MPGSHPAATVEFFVAQVSFAYTCSSGASGTYVVGMANHNYTVGQNNGAWLASGNQQGASTYQGSIILPTLCGSGPIKLHKGGTFVSNICSSAPRNAVSVRWHYSGNGSPGAWSATTSIGPSACTK